MQRSYALRLIAWFLSAFVVTTAVIAWAQDLSWRFSGISGYQWFPVLGLTAFSLMWTHYIVGVIRRLLGVDIEVVRRYFSITSIIVLFAILLHPGILWLQLWRDGFGLPPSSYLMVYGVGGMKLAVVLGSVSLVTFLAFELRRKFGQASWWRYVSYANDLAMLAIVYHSLKLGGQLQGGWYRVLWYFYAVTLVAALVYIRFSWLWQKERV
jgi:hypothetical protein